MCNASPGADLSPLFVALDSEATITGNIISDNSTTHRGGGIGGAPQPRWLAPPLQQASLTLLARLEDARGYREGASHAASTVPREWPWGSVSDAPTTGASLSVSNTRDMSCSPRGTEQGVTS